jgi:hypothetical protein
MLRFVAAAAVAAACLGSAPAAHASLVRTECGYDTFAKEGVTGGPDTFEGASFGYAVFDDGAPHTLRCYVTVDGVASASTPTARGRGLVVTAGPVVMEIPEGATALMCTEIDGVTLGCEGPPDESSMAHMVASIFTLVADAGDPLACPVFSALAPGVPGVVDIAPEGDLTLAGVGPLWDCPPYGNLYPPS